MEGAWIVNILVGILIGAAGTMLYDLVRRFSARAKYGILEIIGTWAEWIPKGIGRQFSVGTIRYDYFRFQYVFDGTNYNNDGTPFCHWRTVTSYLDRSTNELHYVFATKDVSSMTTTSYGYGVVSLIARGRSLVPAGGMYMYSLGVGSAMQMDHTMLRVDTDALPPAGQNASEMLAAAMPDEWAQRTVSDSIDLS